MEKVKGSLSAFYKCPKCDDYNVWIPVKQGWLEIGSLIVTECRTCKEELEITIYG